MSITLQGKALLTVYADRYDISVGDTVTISGEQFILLDTYSNSINGYQGYAYKSLNDGKIYVVHAGSNDLSNPSNWLTVESGNDWIKTDGELVLNILPSQFYSAKMFIDSIKQNYNNNTNNNIEQD